MHPEAYPTTGPAPTPAAAPGQGMAALFRLHGRWVAACPACGCQLATARSQRRAERTGRRRACPVCRAG